MVDEQDVTTVDAPGPDPVKVAAVASAVDDLAAHLAARAAQHPSLADEFKDAVGVVKKLAERAGSVSATEARLAVGLVEKVARDRGHLELGYLTALAKDLELAVLAVV